MRITLIANPRAGRGRTDASLESFLEAVRESTGDAHLLWTQRPGHGVELAREAARDGGVVCACGGDGTVHEVANGLMGTGVPMVIVPSGSGNDFARMFGCPTTPDELVKVVRDGVGARVDAFDTGDRFMFNSAGIGFEAQVTRESRSITRLRGLPLYLTAVFKAMRHLYCPALTIRTQEGDEITGERLLVSVGNGVSAGGGFYLTPDAHPDDGLADVCMVERIGRLRMLRLLPMAIGGKHITQPEVTTIRTAGVSFTSPQSFHVHLDGEYIGERAEIKFSVRERALPVLCQSEKPARLSRGLEPILPV